MRGAIPVRRLQLVAHVAAFGQRKSWLGDCWAGYVAVDAIQLFALVRLSPNSFDTLGTLDAWVSSGSAPERLIATRLNSPQPNAPRLPPLTRPLCPYPQVAEHDGRGSIDSAESFRCVAAP
jgi:hypothetical protein